MNEPTSINKSYTHDELMRIVTEECNKVALHYQQIIVALRADYEKEIDILEHILKSGVEPTGGR